MGTDLVLGFRLGPGLPALGFDISNATGVSFCNIVESAEALDFVIEPVSRQFFAGMLGWRPDSTQIETVHGWLHATVQRLLHELAPAGGLDDEMDGQLGYYVVFNGSGTF